jgi:3-phenylpropionate/trans-cinnamate dioxygenase ferredoxin subunit
VTEPRWHQVGATDDVARDDVLGVNVEETALAIIRTADDRVFAVDAACTHGRASLDEGFVDGNEIECPKHNGRFDVTTGEAVASPARVALRTYPCRVTNGCIEVQL